MGRVASEGLICISEKDNKLSMLEINSETDFVAKNSEFINFAEEVSRLTLSKAGILEDVLKSEMNNKKKVEENLVNLISKIGEKISIRRSTYMGDEKLVNFSYIHSALKRNIGKLGVLLSIETTKQKDDILELGKQLSMHIAASSPLGIDKSDIDEKTLAKEKEIITEELKNTGKDPKILDKIAIGKINKFINDNTLLNQEWIMEPKKKVKDIIKETEGKDKINIKNFVRFKLGEGI
jgi:elongation factor Ts